MKKYLNFFEILQSTFAGFHRHKMPMPNGELTGLSTRGHEFKSNCDGHFSASSRQVLEKIPCGYGSAT